MEAIVRDRKAQGLNIERRDRTVDCNTEMEESSEDDTPADSDNSASWQLPHSIHIERSLYRILLRHASRRRSCYVLATSPNVRPQTGEFSSSSSKTE